MFLFNLYIKSSIHVALAVASFTYITKVQLDITISPAIYLFVFFSTVVSYTFTKYTRTVVQHWNKRPGTLNWILWITAVSAAGAVATAFAISLPVLIAALLFGGLTAAYALPVFGDEKNLRNLFGIKIFIIAFVWMGVTVWLPVISYGISYITHAELALVSIQRFLFVLALILPFDIRDLISDRPSLGTVPQIIGVRRTRVIGVFLLIVVVAIGMVNHPPEHLFFISLAVISVLTGGMILRSMKYQSPYFTSFWVEGIPILWALILHTGDYLHQ